MVEKHWKWLCLLLGIGEDGIGSEWLAIELPELHSESPGAISSSCAARTVGRPSSPACSTDPDSCTG